MLTREDADKFRKAKNYQEALPIYKELWKQSKSSWIGYFIALCLRQLGELENCRQFHEELKALFPNNPQLERERLWLDYRQYVKDYRNDRFLEQAEEILGKTDQYSNDTSKIFIKTVLAVVQRLEDSPEKKLKWLDKLDHKILDNNVFRIGDMDYPSDRKRYFIEYAKALRDLGQFQHYIANQMSKLGFWGSKHNDFFKYMIDSFVYENYNKTFHVSIPKLALIIKNLSDEISLLSKHDIDIFYNKDKKMSVSDLSHYLFCPASYAINRTYKVYSQESWQTSEWEKKKLYLIDRHNLFLATKDLGIVFKDTNIQLTEECKQKFLAIFESKIELNNVATQEPIIMTNEEKSINGAPDYIYRHPKGFRFVITEKFSHVGSSDFDIPFESDLIKHYAFLDKFKNYGLHFGLFLTWYYTYEDIPDDNNSGKHIVILKYRLTKVKTDEKSISFLNKTIEEIEEFNKTETKHVEGMQLSHVKKCLNCSVISYCHHKTGRCDEIELPYKVQPLMVGLTNENNTDIAQDDLPF